MNRERISAGWVFLGLVLAIYAAAAIFDVELVKRCLLIFVRLAFKLVPILIIVFGLTYLLNRYLKRDRVAKLLGPDAGAKGWITMIIGGAFSMGPVYAWYPLLKQLKEEGMSSSLAAVFLYSRGIKLPLLPLMIHYFGWQFTLLVSSLMILFAIINGICTGYLVPDSLDCDDG